ncbi:unnamed protein product [Lampetra fluviatilis]
MSRSAVWTQCTEEEPTSDCDWNEDHGRARSLVNDRDEDASSFPHGVPRASPTVPGDSPTGCLRPAVPTAQHIRFRGNHPLLNQRGGRVLHNGPSAFVRELIVRDTAADAALLFLIRYTE